MTLDEALGKAMADLTEVWEQHEDAELQRLLEFGATDDELAAALERSRAQLVEELHKAKQTLTALWFTGAAGIH